MDADVATDIPDVKTSSSFNGQQSATVLFIIFCFCCRQVAST